MLLRIAAYLRPYVWHTVAIFLCVAAAAAIGLLPPLIVRSIIDKAVAGRQRSAC